MDLEEVRRRAKEIELYHDDFEIAHGWEDDLYLDVLRAIAEGNPDAQELAAEAIKTQGIDFKRYCA